MNALRRQRLACGWRLRLFRLRFGIGFRLGTGFVVIIQRRQFKPKKFLTVKESSKDNFALRAFRAIGNNQIAAVAGKFGAGIRNPFVFCNCAHTIMGDCHAIVGNKTFAITVMDSGHTRRHQAAKRNVVAVISSRIFDAVRTRANVIMVVAILVGHGVIATVAEEDVVAAAAVHQRFVLASA